jgi:hypothetical protein
MSNRSGPNISSPSSMVFLQSIFYFQRLVFIYFLCWLHCITVPYAAYLHCSLLHCCSIQFLGFFSLIYNSFFCFTIYASMGICQSSEDTRESERSCQIDKQLEKERIKQEYKILLLGYIHLKRAYHMRKSQLIYCTFR